jgi:hypothetical protein
LITGTAALADGIDPPWNPPPEGTLNFTVPGIDNVPDLQGDVNDPQLTVFLAGNQYMVVRDLVDAFRAAYPQYERVFVETLPPGRYALELNLPALGGVQQNDILKMLNDQILMEPDQLAKLVRSYSEGTTVTLTILRKGAEMKLTVKLAKRDVPARRDMMGFDKHMRFDQDFGQVGEQMRDQMREQMKDQMENLREQLGDTKGMIHDAVEHAREEVRRARDEARQAARQYRVVGRDGDILRRTRIDLDKAQIVYSDADGEMRVETVDGKKMLTAKDPQGRLVFSGPIEKQEDIDKIPPDVRKRYDKLEQKDLSAAIPSVASDTDADDDNDIGIDVDNDADEDDDDNDNNAPAAGVSLEQVSFRPTLQRAGVLSAVLL